MTTRARATMTKREAYNYILSCGETDGPESYDEAAEIFTAVYERTPDEEDGDAGDLWSLCCAAVNDRAVNAQLACTCGGYDSAHARECPRYGHDIIERGEG